MSIKQRLQEYCKERHTTIGTFCRAAGISQSYFNQVKGDIGEGIREKIANAYKDLNVEWLRTGEGEMLKVPATVNIYNPTAEERQNAGANIDLSVVPAAVVEEIKEELRPEVAEEIKEELAIPIISSEVASAPNTNIKTYIKEKGDELKHIFIGDLMEGAKVAECVEKVSMWPTFQPGDWVFIKFIDKNSIVDGNTYYFDLNTRPTMIRKVKIEGDKLRLIAKNPSYGDIVIDNDEVNNIAEIVGLYRSYFGDQYDEIEAVRRKKDEQVDNLIEQNGQALKIIQDLIKK